VPVWNRDSCASAGTNTNTYTPPAGTTLDPVPPEICDNGIDDNDNGLVDCEDPQCDGFVDGATSCGVGACAATGNLVCQTPRAIALKLPRSNNLDQVILIPPGFQALGPQATLEGPLLFE